MGEGRGIGGKGTHVGAITSPNDQAAVEHEFHVAGPRGFGAGGGDVLANVRGWGEDLGFADIVILDVDNLEEITDILVIVDDLANAADEVDDGFGHPVSRSCFAPEDGYARSNFLAFFGAHGFDGEIAVNHAEDVELLSFVLMYTFDLDVEERFGIDADAGRV